MATIQNRGVQIHYQVEGSGPPLVMLPGFPSSIEDMYELGYVGELKDDYQLILIDPRGFGKSGKPHKAEEYSFEIIVDDIAAVLNELGIEKCHFYGHSIGGWFLYGMAKHHPEKLLSLIISDGVPGSGDTEVLRKILGAFEEFVRSIDGLSEKQVERYLDNDMEALNAIAGWVERDSQAIIDLVDSTIGDIEVPCLVLMSNIPEDSDEFRLLHKTVALVPQADFVEFKELSHFPLFLRSDKVLPHIKQFLADKAGT